MIVTHKIEVDLQRDRILPFLEVMQGDALSRKIEITLKSDGQAWNVPEGISVYIGYRKPDGTKGIYDRLPDETAAWSFVGNVLTVAIAPQVMAVPGAVALAVSLMSGETVVSTFPVIIRVQALPGFEGGSEDYVKVLGIVPSIGENGNWWVGNKDTGVQAKGQDGYSIYYTMMDVSLNTATIPFNQIPMAAARAPAVGDYVLTPDGWLYAVTRLPTASTALCTRLTSLKGADAEDGEDGKDGTTPHIGANGNWWLGETDTGTPAQGEQGPAGAKGDKGDKGDTGPKGEKGALGPTGADGLTPFIGGNGNWWIGKTDTGVQAQGEDYVLTDADKEEIAGMVNVEGGSGVGRSTKGKEYTVDGKTVVGDGTDEVFNAYDGDDNALDLPNEAVGGFAHAEGWGTKAHNIGAHAEGCLTAARGECAHSEGEGTAADATGAHSEGSSTHAKGKYSHAQGSGTIASGEAQHAQGKYNVEDTEGKYAHIVGNGKSNSKRANAHTVDWEGNAWYASKIKVGGTGQDDVNAVEVATKPELKALSEEIADHENDTTKHITSAERTKWNKNATDIIAINETLANMQGTIVDSVEEMTDTSKQYVLKSTGTIWEYKVTTTEQEATITDKIVGTTDNPYETGRLSSSGALSADVTTHTVTPYIDLTKAEYQGKTVQIHLEGNRYACETRENYIMCATFDTAKSVIVGRAYLTSDPADTNCILDFFDNAGMTLEIHSTTSATVTFPVPLVGDDNKTVGYFRFCGQGTVTDSVYITYTDTQTVTGGQWVDTGVAFGSGGGGSVDTETLAKIAELNNEGTDPTTIKLLAQPVLDFYNASAYSDDDYTSTHLGYITYPCRADIPVPYTVKWEHDENAMRTTVAVDTKAIGTNNRYTLKTYDATGFDNYPIYNLLPNTTYYYKVTHVMADGSLVEAKSGNFTTSSESVRMIYIDGTQNVRDLGGWAGLDGQTVQYGKLFRGASFSDSSYPELMLTGKGKRSLGELGVQGELNLGASDTETSIASNVTYTKIGYSSYATAITDDTKKTLFKTALEWIVDRLTNSQPVYFHCQGGCDRTGTLSFQLLGLLGVSESDLAKEYELSSFSSVGYGRLRTTTLETNTYDYVGMVEALKAYSGDTITDKFYDFATTGCGISADTITAFRNLMLE